MTSATIRETCGTLAGLLAHQAAGESPCGDCAHASHARRVAAEGVPSRPPGSLLAPVTEAEASEHRAVLSAETLAWERGHRGFGRYPKASAA